MKIRASWVIFIIGLFLANSSVFAWSKVENIRFYHDTPHWQPRWEAAGKVSAEDIGIGLNPIEYHIEIHKTRVRMDLPTQRAPALFKWWFGYQALPLVEAELVADLSDVWDEVGEFITPGVREALTIKGVTYGFPMTVTYWGWYYNKPLFEKYGLKPPETWDEFMDQLEFFKEHGIYGIGNAIGPEVWPTFIMFQELLYRIDPNFYNRLMGGKAHWTDPKTVQAMEIWKKMLEKGYFVPVDASYVEDFPTMLKRGKLAYAPYGDWYGGTLQQAGLVSGEDYDWCVIPPITPAGEGAMVIEIAPFIAGKNSPQLDLAKEWLKWWGSSVKAANIRWQEWKFVYTPHIPAEVIAREDPVLAKELETVGDYPNKLIRFWEATPFEIVEFAGKQFEQMMVQPDKYMNVLKNIEEKAKEVWAEYGVEY